MRLPHINIKFVIAPTNRLIHSQRVRPIGPREPPQHIRATLFDHMSHTQCAHLRGLPIAPLRIDLIPCRSQRGLHRPHVSLHSTKMRKRVRIITLLLQRPM